MAKALATLQATVLDNPWIPHDPTERQAVFLMAPHKEAFYGGAAGGGKSDALLMAALQYVEIPGYAAILFRRTYQDLSLPGALIDRAHQWLDGSSARWRETEHTWYFPHGSKVSFGYLQTENDKYRYKSAEFQFVGFDELTSFTKSQYTYLYSRLRRLAGSELPLRMRSASNPGDLGHEWVKLRFVVPEEPNPARVFIPAKLEDNPYLDQEEYVASLNELDPVTRAQLLAGDWSARQEGGMFRREWFRITGSYPQKSRKVRFWDIAATEPKPGQDPDWTAGCLMVEQKGQVWVVDMRHTKSTPKGVEDLIAQTARLDGLGVAVRMEQEPGASGKALISHYARDVLRGFDFRGVPPIKNKVTRAAPLSSAAENGNVALVEGAWIPDFLEEIEAFPNYSHDDQVDAASGAHQVLCGGQPKKRIVVYHDPVEVSPI